MDKVTLIVLLFLGAFILTECSYPGKVFGSYGGFLSEFIGCTGCPYRHCLDDFAVVHGYCCGCARDIDHLPLHCPELHIDCPPNGKRLCRDYDYMMDCCCHDV